MFFNYKWGIVIDPEAKVIEKLAVFLVTPTLWR